MQRSDEYVVKSALIGWRQRAAPARLRRDAGPGLRDSWRRGAGRALRGGALFAGRRRRRRLPDAELRGPRLILATQQRLLVPDIGAAGDHLAESVPDQLRVDHHVAEPDVGQEPALGVPLLDVELEPHVLGVRQAAIELERLAALRVAGVGTAVTRIRRGHADVADALDVAVDEDVDGVAAHDLDDGGGQAARPPRLLAPRGRDQEEQERAGEEKAPDRSRHYLRPSLSERSRASRRRRSAAS